MRTTIPAPAIELHTPTALERYMADARNVAAATLEGPSGRNWRANLESRIHGYVAAAIVAVKYDGVTPGEVPKPTIVTRSVVEPYRDRNLVGVWTNDKTAHGENVEATRAYRADRQDLQTFHADVEHTVDEILSDAVRARAAYVHFLALEEARHKVEQTRQREAADLETTLRYTDPITGVCEPSHGDITARSILPGASLPKYENSSEWYAVESSALTHLLLQHRLAQRILERRPDLAKSVDRLVDELISGANL